jgi:hypothetical protein
MFAKCPDMKAPLDNTKINTAVMNLNKCLVNVEGHLLWGRGYREFRLLPELGEANGAIWTFD